MLQPIMKSRSPGKRLLHRSCSSHLCHLYLTVTLLCLLSLTSQALSGHRAFAHAHASYLISGTVFDDYNQDGRQQFREPGVNGVVVKAYDTHETEVATATTHTSSGVPGQYTLSIAGEKGPVRVQFSNFGASSTLPALVGFQASKRIGGTSVAFVDGNRAVNTLNLGLERPSEYCQNNPAMITSCYVRGDQTNPTDHVVVRFPYNSTGTETTNPPTPLATAPQVGATWGLAYRRSSDDLFAAAYTKQFVGYKPGGSTGAIYSIHGANSAYPTVAASPFIDLNAVFGTDTAGTDPHTISNNYVPDLSAYDAVGKVALGGLALSEDESTLYAMNLADRSLYSIPIGTAPNAPVAPGAASITHDSVPTPADCSAGDLRPFAVTSYQNLIYVGAVCSAESTITTALPEGNPTALKAYVFAYTPGTGFNTTPVFEAPLNYTRHCGDRAFNFASTCTLRYSALWNPWQPSSAQAYTSTVYPQPMLTSIAFDNGDMVLGLRDRYGDQTGHAIPNLPESRSAGDLLRACQNTPGDLSSGWTLENNGTCGTISIIGGRNNGKGPGNGQYYYQQYYAPYHDYTSTGGVAQVPGFPGVMTTAFDSGTIVYAGGVRTYSNTTGVQTNTYQIYNTNTIPTTFGKANALGDLVALCQSAPVEIGDRIWIDSNGNGVQDGGEPGLANVTVHLYAADGKTLLQTTTTDAAGDYSFSIAPYTKYEIKLDNVSDYTTGPLKGYQLTLADQDSTYQGIDSRGVLPSSSPIIGEGNFPQIMVNAHKPGQNDYRLDVGFLHPLPLPTVNVSMHMKQAGGKAEATSHCITKGRTISYELDTRNALSSRTITASVPVTVFDTIPSGISGIKVSGTDWHITMKHKGKDTLLMAVYRSPHRSIAPGAPFPAITITGTIDKTAGRSLRSEASVNVIGKTFISRNSTTTNSLSVCANPSLPPTGSDPFPG